jgi:UDP-N-acetylglucosamine 2-epimerase (non-hydrolysing)
MRMPEEINRLVTDSISDWFFCTEPSGVDNLLREGKSKDVVFHVGHVMVDNLLYQRDQLDETSRAWRARRSRKVREVRCGDAAPAVQRGRRATLRGIASARCGDRGRAAADLSGASAHPRQPREVRPRPAPTCC